MHSGLFILVLWVMSLASVARAAEVQRPSVAVAAGTGQGGAGQTPARLLWGGCEGEEQMLAPRVEPARAEGAGLRVVPALATAPLATAPLATLAPAGARPLPGALLPVPPSAAEVLRVPSRVHPLVHGLVVGAAGSALFLGSSTAGFLGGRAVPVWAYERQGRPEVFATALGLGLGFGLHVATSHLLVPLTAHLTGGAVDAGREEGWRRGRWAVLAGGLGLAAAGVGAAMERREFGAGQGLMLAGAGVTVLSGVAFSVLQLTGVVHGSWVPGTF
jgi:hypothetical protein